MQWGGIVLREYSMQEHVPKLRKIPVIPMLHPSAVLHQKSNGRVFAAHLQSVVSFIGGKKAASAVTPMSYKVLYTSGEIRAFLLQHSSARCRPMVFDFETTELEPTLGVPVCVGLCEAGSLDAVIISFAGGVRDDVRRAFSDWLRSPVPKVAHNAKFEAAWSRIHFGVEPANLVDDTYQLHHLLDEESLHNLEILAHRYTPYGGYDNWMKQWRDADGNKTSDAPDKELFSYCSGDVITTGLIRNTLRPTLEEDSKLLDLYNEITLPAVRTLARIEERGIKVDRARMAETRHDIQRRCEEATESLNKEPVIQEALLLCGVRDGVFNFQSSKQTSTLLYDVLKLDVLRTTKNGAPSTRREVIEALEDKHPVLKQISAVRSMQHDLDVIDQIMRKLRNDGTTSCNWHQGYVVTGRLNCTDFNAQALKRTSDIRKALVSRFKGGSIVTADYMQLELMLVANESLEPALLEVFKAGGDVHGVTAAEIFGQNYTDEQRCQAKRVSFGVVYGIGAKELAWHLKKPDDIKYAKTLLARHRKTYPMVSRYIEAQRDFAVEYGFVRSRLGRVRHLPAAKSGDTAAVLQASNFPIQSFAADMTAWAMTKVDSELVRRGYKSCLIAQVHDSLIVDAHPSEVKRVSELLVDTMTKKLPQRYPVYVVELRVDVTISDTW
jgi:DNA polymerase-1